MEAQLTNSEINEAQQMLQDYSPAQETIALLFQNNGQLNITNVLRAIGTPLLSFTDGSVLPEAKTLTSTENPCRNLSDNLDHPLLKTSQVERNPLLSQRIREQN
jgi:hypothetical protein